MRRKLRGHGATVLVAALATAFGVGLLGATEVLIAAASTTGPSAQSPSARLGLSIVALVFTGISLYVAAIVTTNTVATIVAGRIRQIALARLLGATARQERRRIAAEGLNAGFLGAAAGTVGIWATTWTLVRVGVANGRLPEADYRFITATMLVPVAAVVLCTWLAAWVGSRRILTVTPVQALAATVPVDARTTRTDHRRNRAAVVLAIVGVVVLAAGAAIGQVNSFGLIVALPGGVLSFTGFMLGATAMIPFVLAKVGRLLGRDAATTLGTRNPLQFPQRSTRAAVGLVIGVGVVTMFMVAGRTAQEMIYIRTEQEFGVDVANTVNGDLEPLMAILGFLVGFSAIIAAVGLVNTLTVGVLQRAREFGLIRALGLTRAQLRRVITVEAVQLAATAVIVSLLLGIGYGWVGAQSLLGFSQVTAEGYRVIPPIVSWWLVAGIVVVSAVLAIVGSLVPARRAVRISPVEALAVD